MGEKTWDLCVIGAGPAGYAAAMRAHDLGKRVVLVEKARVGGAGIHAGALSSKTMWHLSNDFSVARRTDRGYRAEGLTACYRDVIDTVRAAVTERRELLERQLKALSEPSASGGCVQRVHGSAKFLSPTELEVSSAGGELRKIVAEKFLIATGSRPRALPGMDIDGERIVTSDHIEGLPEFPKSVVIVGAGVIGCEYATIFANFAQTDVRIIDRQPRILPFEDEDVAEVVAKSFEAQGVTLHRESKLESLGVRDGQVEYVVTGPSGKAETHRVERALVSIGRVPNTAGLDLEKAGVEVDTRGGVVADGTRTTAPHIHAAGDVTMDIALVNVAELEARHAVESMFDADPRPIRYEALSAIMFLRPEVASVGLNEIQAKEKGVSYRVGVVDNRLIGRNVAMRSTTGFVKLLAERGTDKILGLRVVGPQASSTVQGCALLIDQGATLHHLDRCVHPHPAVPEGVQECARMLLGRSVFKATVFGPAGLMRCSER